MPAMGIPALGPRPRATRPKPGHTIFPYLMRGLTVERPNQLWAADITYNPVRPRFPLSGGDHGLGEPGGSGVAAIQHMDASFCVAALEEAMARFGRREIFNTDSHRIGAVPGGLNSNTDRPSGRLAPALSAIAGTGPMAKSVSTAARLPCVLAMRLRCRPGRQHSRGAAGAAGYGGSSRS